VFNIEQVSGIVYESAVKRLSEFEKNENCEAITAGYKDRPEITHLRQQASYSPSDDVVNMPIKESFESSQEYYATLFHELVHSTGHSKRLDREGVKDLNVFGSETYSKEELVAEMGASFLCARTGIENRTFQNAVAYIKGWLSIIKKDSKFLVQSATQAQKAADYILNTEPKKEETP
jgi:antirestriction protein ArdC